MKNEKSRQEHVFPQKTSIKVQLLETTSIKKDPQPYSPKARPLQKAASITQRLKVIAVEENSRSGLSDMYLSHCFMLSYILQFLPGCSY